MARAAAICPAESAVFSRTATIKCLDCAVCLSRRARAASSRRKAGASLSRSTIAGSICGAGGVCAPTALTPTRMDVHRHAESSTFLLTTVVGLAPTDSTARTDSKSNRFAGPPPTRATRKTKALTISGRRIAAHRSLKRSMVKQIDSTCAIYQHMSLPDMAPCWCNAVKLCILLSK